jgi:hypothetical protein
MEDVDEDDHAISMFAAEGEATRPTVAATPTGDSGIQLHA